MFWVELTSQFNGVVLVNLDAVEAIFPEKDGSKLHVAGDENSFWLVRETPAQIAALLPSVRRCGEETDPKSADIGIGLEKSIRVLPCGAYYAADFGAGWTVNQRGADKHGDDDAWIASVGPREQEAAERIATCLNAYEGQPQAQSVNAELLAAAERLLDTLETAELTDLPNVSRLRAALTAARDVQKEGEGDGK